MRSKVYITRDCPVDGYFSVRNCIKRAVFAALDAEGITISCEVSALLTNDEGIRALNRDFRDLDKPTDVLSFPANNLTAGQFAAEGLEINSKTGRVVLGDMAISIERARAQAEEFGHGTKRELQYLTVHSVLHLLGYDHEDEGAQKAQMRAREKEIMKKLGVRDD